MSAPTALVINIMCSEEGALISRIDGWLISSCSTLRNPASLIDISDNPTLIDVPAMATYYGVYKVFSDKQFIEFMDICILPDLTGAVQVLMCEYHDYRFTEIYYKNTY